MKQILLTLAIALLALGAWFFLGTTTTVAPVVGPTPVAPTPTPTEAERSGPELEVADVEPAPASERSAVEATEQATAASAAPTDGLVLAEPVADGIEFQVVVDATGEPLPHAILTGVGQARAEEGGAQQMMMAGAGIDTILDAIGVHYRCDAEGRVTIDPRNADALIRGRGEVDGRLHSGMSEGDGGERIVRARPVAGFDVRVVDVGGAPVSGVRVDLVIERDFGPMSQRMTFNSVEVDAEGRAFLANTMANLPSETERMLDEARVLISLAGLFTERPEVEIDWRATEPEPVELVAPATGQVAVSITLPSGEPPAGLLMLHLPDADESMFGMPDGRSLIRAITGEEAAAGPVVFEGVERGLPFELSYEVDGQPEPERRTGLVLASDQARLQLELELQLQVQRLAGRVLLPSGEPLADTEVYIGRVRSWRSTAEPLDRVTTDAAGSFELPAPWFEGDSFKLWFRTSAGEELAATLPHPSSVPAVEGVHRLGDLILEGEIVLLAGRVVDADGEGVSVQLILTERQPGPARIQSVAIASVADEAGAESVHMPDAQRWEARSSDSGAFIFHGRTDAESLSLTARSERYLVPPALEASVGTEDLVLTLERASRFHFELPEMHWMMTNSISLVVPTEGPDTTYHSIGDGWSPPLPPGTHDFYLSLGGGADAKVYEGTVQLASGEERELGMLTLDRPILHQQVRVELVGDGDPGRVRSYARRRVVAPDGSVTHERLGYATRSSWYGSGEGDEDVHHFFTLEPIDEVVVRLGSAKMVAPVGPGETTVVFDPALNQAEQDDVVREALQGLGYR